MTEKSTIEVVQGATSVANNAALPNATIYFFALITVVFIVAILWLVKNQSKALQGNTEVLRKLSEQLAINHENNEHHTDRLEEILSAIHGLTLSQTNLSADYMVVKGTIIELGNKITDMKSFCMNVNRSVE